MGEKQNKNRSLIAPYFKNRKNRAFSHRALFKKQSVLWSHPISEERSKKRSVVAPYLKKSVLPSHPISKKPFSHRTLFKTSYPQAKPFVTKMNFHLSTGEKSLISFLYLDGVVYSNIIGSHYRVVSYRLTTFVGGGLRLVKAEKHSLY